MKKYLSLFLVVAFLISGCAGLDPRNLKSNHAKANWINNTYIQAFQDHGRYSGLQNLTPEAKTLLNSKRLILIEIADPLYGPVPVFNNYIVTGQIITDAMFNGILDKLLLLETGWYTDTSQMQAFALNPKFTDDQIKAELIKANILDSAISTQTDPMFMGVLLELIRTGIHAIRAMLAQRGLDEAQMIEAWKGSWASFKSLDPESLVILE